MTKTYCVARFLFKVSLAMCIVFVSVIALFSCAGGSESCSFEFNEPFLSVIVDVDAADISITESDTETCSVVIENMKKDEYTASVTDGILRVSALCDSYFTLFGKRANIAVSLPKDYIDNLKIECSSGNIDINHSLGFGTVTVEVDSGNVKLFDTAANIIEIESDTGNTILESVNAGSLKINTDTGNTRLSDTVLSGKLDIETDTGDTILESVKGESLKINTETGNMRLSDTVLSGKLDIEADTGDLLLERSDASEISIKARSGDVTAHLLSEKIVYARSNTGKINTPTSIVGGLCEITTTTGDITVTVVSE